MMQALVQIRQCRKVKTKMLYSTTERYAVLDDDIRNGKEAYSSNHDRTDDHKKCTAQRSERLEL